jgi:hypothetical protein
MELTLAQSALPAPEAVRETARQVVARPYFEIDSRPRDGVPIWLEILRWIIAPFRWLFNSLEGLPDVLRWTVVVVCILVCIALVAHIIYTLVAAVRGPAVRRNYQVDAQARDRDPRDYEDQAEQFSSQGDYIGAVRSLFRAAIRRLEILENKKFRPGITNRELLRRYRTTPLFDPLVRFVNTIELKWYGQAPCQLADYITCRDDHGRICQYINESKPVHGS